jgi:DNA topoisomerase VI subunit A
MKRSDIGAGIMMTVSWLAQYNFGPKAHQLIVQGKGYPDLATLQLLSLIAHQYPLSVVRHVIMLMSSLSS